MSKHLVKVAGERRERSGPMRISFFFSSTGSQIKVILPNPSPMYGFSFHLTERTKTKTKTLLCVPRKVLKVSVIFQTASFPHPFTQSCVLLLVGEGFETRPQVSRLINAGVTGVWHCAWIPCDYFLMLALELETRWLTCFHAGRVWRLWKRWQLSLFVCQQKILRVK